MTDQVQEIRVCNSGDKAATDADNLFIQLFGPNALQVDANGRENGHVQDGQKGVGNISTSGDIQGYAAEPQIHNTRAI